MVQQLAATTMDSGDADSRIQTEEWCSCCGHWLRSRPSFDQTRRGISDLRVRWIRRLWTCGTRGDCKSKGGWRPEPRDLQTGRRVKGAFRPVRPNHYL